MPTLLRLAMVALSTAVLMAGAVLLAVAGTLGGSGVAWGALALVALTLPPLVAGAFVSLWRWDGDTRRALRGWLVGLAAVQAAGLAALVVAAAAAPGRSAALVPIAVLAVAEDPAMVLIGRRIQRLEARAAPAAAVDAGARVLADVRRAWRRYATGAVVGFALGAAGVAVAALTAHDAAFALRLSVFVPAVAALGAVAGGGSVLLPLSTTVRDLLGRDYTSSRRIGLAIRGRQDDLTADEAERAARYAAVAPAWTNLQLGIQATNLLVSLSVLLSLGLSHADLRWLLPAFAAVVAVCTALVVVLRRVQLGRLRRYAAAHPVAA